MIVGVTGHQRITPASLLDWVSESLENAVSYYGLTEGLTCLAIGADQLFARVLITKNIPYCAVIPSSDYNSTFKTSNSLKEFEKLRSHAKNIVQLPFEHPTEEAFLEGGKYVVTKSQILFAVWDGKPSKGKGGTADIVDFAAKNGKIVIHFNVENRSISEY